MNKEQLQKLLPHRDAMLLVDEAELREGKSYGKYHFRGDEWFFRGHFPGDPVVPGVILCEILAQSAAVMLGSEQAEGTIPFFTGIEHVRFRHPVRPGDTVETQCEIVKSKHPFYFAAGSATVNGKLCVKAEFSFALQQKDSSIAK